MPARLPPGEALQRKRARALVHNKAAYAKDPDKFKRYAKAGHERLRADPEKWEQRLAEKKDLPSYQAGQARATSRRTQRYKDDPAYRLQRTDYYTKLAYGITQREAGKIILEVHGGVCPICKCPPEPGKRNPWHIDHDHVTGELRGILCMLCNAALGLFRDNPELCEAGGAYLRNPPLRSTKWSEVRAHPDGRRKRKTK